MASGAAIANRRSQSARRLPAANLPTTAPVTRSAAPVRRFSGPDDLQSFLADDLRLNHDAIRAALDEAKQSGAGTIYPLILTTRQIRKLGLS